MVSPHSLRARGHENPLNLGPGPIELAWAGDEDGSWKIQAARSAEFDIDHLVWESPWHSRGTALYDGPHPNPHERIYWRVGQRHDDETVWSEAAYFEAPAPENWRAQWVNSSDIRHEFDVPGVPTWARLSILNEADVVLIINGEILAVLQSDHLNVFDVTSLMAEGNNEIVIESEGRVAMQIDGRLDTTLDFGTHTDEEWLPEGAKPHPVRTEELRLA